MNKTEDADFFIAFQGAPSRFPSLLRFFERLKAVKESMTQIPVDSPDLEDQMRDPAWIDLLDSDAFEWITTSGEWGLEDLVDCVLNGEYLLQSLTFDGRAGR